MSATPPPNSSTPSEPTDCEWTQADQDAIFASVVWVRDKLDPALYEKYKGMHVAVLGERIIDADKDEDELIRRVKALGDAIPQKRVFIEYLMTPEEAWRYWNY
jgi:hypothetical protein